MKKRIRLFAGIMACGFLVAMNLRHAYNNYGITKDSWILRALATDSIPLHMHECGDDGNGNKTFCNARASEKYAKVLCDHYYTYVVAQTPRKPYYRNKENGTYYYLYTDRVILHEVHSHDDSGWVYVIPDFSNLYITSEDYLTGNFEGKIEERSLKLEFYQEPMYVTTEYNECIQSSGSSCFEGGGMVTVCKAEFQRRYANGGS